MKQVPWPGVLAIAALTLLAYAPVLRCGYVWDDDQYLTRNVHVTHDEPYSALWSFEVDSSDDPDPDDGLLVRAVGALLEAAGHPPGSKLLSVTPQYYPLVFTTFRIEHALWGLDPVGYHLVQVLIHLTTALLLWRIGTRLEFPWPWFVAAVFAVHPVHVESVAWVTERKNTLGGLFYALTVLAWLRYDDGRGLRWLGVAALTFACAMLSKTVVAMLAPSLLLVLWWRHRKLEPRRVAATLPFFVLGGVFGLMTAYLEQVKVGAMGAEWSQTALERSLILAPTAYWFYFSKIAWPSPLAFMYARWETDATRAASYLPLALTLAALALWWVRRRRWGPGPLLLSLYAAFNLFPALGFLKVYPHRYSWVADHFQYFASTGFIVLLVSGLFLLARRIWPAGLSPAAARAGGAVLLSTLGLLTWRQIGDYENETVLWENTLAKSPTSWIARTNLGKCYLEEVQRLVEEQRREPDPRRREELGSRVRELLEQSESHLLESSRLPFGADEAFGLLGTLYQYTGRLEDAHRCLTKVMELLPEDSRPWVNRAGVNLRLGRPAEALADARRAVQLEPRSSTGLGNLALALEANGRPEEALGAFEEAIRWDRTEMAGLRRDRARLLLKLGRHAAAAEAYGEVVERDPGDADSVAGLSAALCNLGRYAEALAAVDRSLAVTPPQVRLLAEKMWILAVSPDDRVRNASAALALARTLPQGVGGGPRFLDALAAAQAELERYEEAVRTATEAAGMARRIGREELVRGIEGRIELYRARKPYRHAPPPRGGG